MSKKQTKWKSETIIQFLELYEQCPCLWDVHSEQYKNKEARENCYLQIAQSMNIEGFGSSEVKAKIRSIRNAYTLELGKIEKSKKSGSGTDELYTPKLTWFKIADRILHHVVQIRETQSKEIETQATEIETQATEVMSPGTADEVSRASMTSTSESVMSPPNNELRTPTIKLANAPKRYKTTRITTTEKAIQDLKGISQTLTQMPPEDNEFDCFGKTTACHLKKMPESVALQSMAFIQSSLVNQRIKIYQPPNPNSNINAGTSHSQDSSCESQETYNNNLSKNYYNLDEPPNLRYTERRQDPTFESEDNENNTFINHDILSDAVRSILNNDNDIIEDF